MLLKLLTWPRVDTRPDLAVVLVDEDGQAGRRTMLETRVKDVAPRLVVGVAVRELESWLLADVSAVNAVAGNVVDEPPSVEALDPGEAKRLLANATGGRAGAFAKRVEIAKTADLDRLAKLRAFESFRKALRAASEA